MSAHKYDLRMPAKYRVLSDEEMEYDGGITPWNLIASAVITTVGIATTMVGLATNNDKLKMAGNVLTFVGLAASGYGIVANGGRLLAGSTSTWVGANFAFDATLGVGLGIAGLIPWASGK